MNLSDFNYRDDNTLLTSQVSAFFKDGNDITKEDTAVCGIWIENCHISAVKEVLENDTNSIIDLGYLLSTASDYGKLDLVKCLVDKGADISYKDNQATKLAKMSKHHKVVDYLT